jgi:hypothetical protein
MLQVTTVAQAIRAGFCRIFNFEARVSDAVTCPNAASLLRIR